MKLVIPSLSLLAAVVCSAQTPTPRLEFEVASIKPSPGGRGRFFGTDRGGDFNAKNMPLKAIIAEAYNVKQFQLYGVPGWLGSDAFDITAKPQVDRNEKPVSRATFEARWADLMLRLQTLLEDRCALKVHRETKELPVYTVTIAKGGLKLKPADCVEADFDHPPGPPTPGQALPCGNLRMGRDGLNATLNGYGITMEDLLTRWLPQTLDRTVIDKTGYTGKFNLTVEWAPDTPMRPADGDDPTKPAPAPDSAGPSIFTALQEQLGLKLDATKGSVEVLVIDHVEKPSAN
jgi:uncharacterized protein (TIGR03435 family)